MASILFAWELGGHAGHCAALVPLIADLRSRGHAVFLAACDVATAHRMRGELGVQILPTPSSPLPPLRQAAPRSFAHILANVGFADAERLASHIEAWRNLLKLAGPDIIVAEHAPTALLASRGLDCRRVAMGTGFTLPPQISPWPDLRPWLDGGEHLPADEEALLDRVNSALFHSQITPLERLASIYSDVDARVLVAFPELDHQGNRPAEKYFGSWSLPIDSLPTWPDTAGPRVFAYVKTYPGIWNAAAVVQALVQQQCSALVYLGGAGVESLATSPAPHVQIVNEPVNIHQVATEADAAILNGTAVTTAEMLLGGTPVLQVPISLEQTLMANRIVELGAGILIDARRPDLLSASIRRICDDSLYRDSAIAFAGRHAPLLRSHRIAQACDAIIG
jgi:UDP:flavonoid glycosyltransferase YjiC (YdhE family)